MKIKWVIVITLIVIGNLLGNFILDIPDNLSLPMTLIFNAVIFGLIFLWKEEDANDNL